MDDGRIAQVGAAASGAAMDRVVARKRWSRRLAVAGGTVVALAAVGLWWLYAPHGSNRQTVDAAAVSIATVARERFEDYVPLRAQVEPARTVFLDAVEGGRVERLWVEDGARVRRGQALVELSNAGLQLDAVSREAQVIEQLNGVRALELALERNRLERDTSRAEIEYRLSQQRRDLAQQEALARAGFISAAALARLREDMDYQVVRHRLALENDAVTGRMQAEQLEQLRIAARRLRDNLALAQRNLEALTVRAPADGQLTAFALQEGQSLARGARIGQIDTPDEVRLTAGLDQFYLPRVAVGQEGSVELDGGTRPLRVAKVYPQVANGEFRVDLEFREPPGADLRRGQTVQARLTLGRAETALVLPNAAFLQDSGGAFVFVVAADGASAERRTVRLGRRNPRYVEVLDGLSEGERVLVSSYAHFVDRDRLKLAR